ncbi:MULTISPECIES: DEAD/DEAH box helicase [Bacillus]|jgi:DEAD/DEAH box helicase domain-containing protein|uniref:ATP-dependent helicase n=1 Tax=Bacillus amyloliquefaciens (strain ATCC 23350 / DSM 7 / BCRC 11601 / CCUG 28519 / NBRC 15535 / NRRL B-14393 / F) TaxID=692420 RepID=A0A9P1JHV3_BACAS|nr:DEAD/DEAH box helicase [Bacillus amyloliquefaciens]AIW34179.1 ATP-dependent helicase [Bacillus subtilis]AEB23353.1 ATP-dependent helicase [Bacillus amyloliquefaciens TA208]AEB63937.1 putative ATP-dependent helicase [Bacillus amyloliquefaciens LL3]AEK88368.1 putative ATP-dependent helicase [Bacillus amyloliquefaciens XH7]ARW39384.1 putative ATP-dependent helicase YprA [Bacillus amyloliquefaciens]
MKKKSLSELIQELKDHENIVHWHEEEPREAKTMPMPDKVNPKIRAALKKRGIERLFTHQYSAFQTVQTGESIVAVTPTASGKTLCYNLPVLQSIAEDSSSRALYLFPTKALAQDQKSELNEIIDETGMDIKSFTYDGDTSPAIRQKVRKAGHIVITNPDMLHSAILPHHTKWVSLFENLKYIVIDELHTYRGVFGSHVANVIRRLMRICAFYGSTPLFICTSATIANPRELAEQLTGNSVKLIDDNGAPSGRKHFAFYNPPIVNKPLHIRKSATVEVNELAKTFLKNKIQTIVFARSRVRVEIILSHIQEIVKKEIGAKSVRGYRGGYLPKERREIERGLRDGSILGVVSTNALELGVDIGQLQVCVMTGYPGSVASAWQQAGRAGRRQGEALIVMVANSDPIDQYIVRHPDYFFKRSPESARINPDNLIILVDHLKCAAYELPFRADETFGENDARDILEYLEEEGVLHENRERYHWASESFPASNISLRSASQENVVIVDRSETADVKIIGEMDRFSAMTLLHDEAIYLHEGVQYQVEKLDWEHKKAYVRKVDVEYYTDANLAVQLKVLEIDRSESRRKTAIHFGDVTVNALPTIFKKIKMTTFENIGSGPIHLPEEELHTSAAWLELKETDSEIGEKTLEQLLLGIAHVLQHIVPVYVMCDRNDVHVVPQIKAAHTGLPTIFLYDHYPGGIGLADEVYKRFDEINEGAERLIRQCPCQDGCPSCIGSEIEGIDAKKAILRLLNYV